MNQRTWKTRAAALAAAATMATTAAACMFFWTGNGSDDNFANSANWAPQVLPCPVPFPSRPVDDAEVPWNVSGPWAIDLIPVNINSLTLKGSVDFKSFIVPSNPPPATLTAATLRITPTQGDIEITVTSGAEIAVP